MLVPALAVGANGAPVNTGLCLGANLLSIVKLAVEGATVTATRLAVLSGDVKVPPVAEVTLSVLAAGGVTVTVLTVCETVASSFAIR